MRLLLTRTDTDGDPFVAALERRGVQVVHAPVLRIVPLLDAAVALDGVQALLFTSANGVSAFTLRERRRDVPVLAVGAATAEAARRAGFQSVESADDDGAALARLAAARLDPAGGRVLHVSGADVAGDLAGTLAAAGFAAERIVLYRAEPERALPEAAIRALAAGAPDQPGERPDGAVDGVVFFSPRGAEVFGTLVRSGALAEGCRGRVAYCLSEAVARAAGGLPWSAVRVAPAPNADSLLWTIDRDRRGADDGQAMTEQDKPAAPPGGQGRSDRPADAGGTPNTRDTAARDAAARPEAVRPEAVRPEAAPVPRRSGPTILVTALVAAVVAILVGLALPPLLGPIHGRGGTDQTIAAIDRRLAALEGRPAGGGEAEARLKALEDRMARDRAEAAQALARVEAAVAALPRPASAPDLGPLDQAIRRLDGALAGLTQRLDTLEKRIAERPAEGRAEERQLLALGQLREAVFAGKPLTQPLALANGAFADDPEALALLAAFEAEAERGVADPAALARRFDAAAVVQAARRNPEGDWVDRTLDRLGSVVTVRRVADAPEGSPDAAVAAAEKALAEGNVARALAALAPIEAAATRAIPDWMRAARARVAAEERLGALSRHLAARLGRADAASAPGAR